MSFKTQVKVEFLLLGTGSKKVLGIMPGKVFLKILDELGCKQIKYGLTKVVNFVIKL